MSARFRLHMEVVLPDESLEIAFDTLSRWWREEGKALDVKFTQTTTVALLPDQPTTQEDPEDLL